MKSALIVLAFAFLNGCASQGGYRQLPSAYTAIPEFVRESYLIEAMQAFGRPIARRFDFADHNDGLIVEIHTFTPDGEKPLVKKQGEEAGRIRKLFRGFDWNAIEPPPLEKGVVAMFPDDVELILKAQTDHVYREAHGGMAECATLGALFEAVMAEASNKSPDPTSLRDASHL